MKFPKHLLLWIETSQVLAKNVNVVLQQPHINPLLTLSASAKLIKSTCRVKGMRQVITFYSLLGKCLNIQNRWPSYYKPYVFITSFNNYHPKTHLVSSTALPKLDYFEANPKPLHISRVRISVQSSKIETLLTLPQYKYHT